MKQVLEEMGAPPHYHLLVALMSTEVPCKQLSSRDAPVSPREQHSLWGRLDPGRLPWGGWRPLPPWGRICDQGHVLLLQG